MSGDRFRVHGEALHREIAITQCAKDEVLDPVLFTAQRAEAHELLRESDLLGEALLDRGDDAVA